MPESYGRLRHVAPVRASGVISPVVSGVVAGETVAGAIDHVDGPNAREVTGGLDLPGVTTRRPQRPTPTHTSALRWPCPEETRTPVSRSGRTRVASEDYRQSNYYRDQAELRLAYGSLPCIVAEVQSPVSFGASRSVTSVPVGARYRLVEAIDSS